MHGSWFPAALLSALILAQPPGPARAGPAAGAGLPADAAAYVTRREGCNHWTGEDAYDAARGREIAAAVERLRCDTVEADETRLRRRYRGNPAVLRALDTAGRADG